MKNKNILLVGDLHTGVRKDDPKLESIIVDWFDQAIEYSKKNGINTWIQTGDWFDVRSAISHITMELMSKTLSPKLRSAGIMVHVIVGNHDMKHKNKIRPNAVEEVLAQYSDIITTYAEPSTVNFNGCDIDLIPWMCEENIEYILDFIKKSGSRYCVGHWELNGYYFYKNQPSTGYDPSFLSKYDQVFSGHFHTISESGNVLYIGTPYTITYGDENDPRGSWVFDTVEESWEFIQNAKMWHQRIEYPECYENFDPTTIDGCFVKVIINDEDDNLNEFENILLKHAYEYRMIRSNKALTSIFGFDDEDDVTINEDGTTKNLLEISKEYIDGISLEKPVKEKVKDLVEKLFNKTRE